MVIVGCSVTAVATGVLAQEPDRTLRVIAATRSRTACNSLLHSSSNNLDSALDRLEWNRVHRTPGCFHSDGTAIATRGLIAIGTSARSAEVKMRKSLLPGAALVIIVMGMAEAQTVPNPTPRPAIQQEQTSGIQANQFTGNLVGITVYALKPASGADASSPASPTTAQSQRAPSAETRQDSRPALISDERWRSMRERYNIIGEVNDLVLSGDGRIHQVVLGVGGFLGIGEKNVAVAWSDLRLMRASDGRLFAIVERTKDQLKAMPTFIVERE